MPDNDVEIVGRFERISYTVCYEFEGTILPPSASTLLPACTAHYPGDTVTTANKPSATGYEFVGWYKNATFTMPEKNVVIYGEWRLAPAGKFAPILTKVILNPKDEYDYGDTVQFKVTITNTAEYAIRDVYISEILAGAIIDESPNNSYSIVGGDTAFIANIAPGVSVDIFASYLVRENKSQTIANTVKLIGALADNNRVLDQSQEYTATVTFTTVAEPAPFTGIIFNPAIYVGIIALALVCLLLARIKPSQNRRSANGLLRKVRCLVGYVKNGTALTRLSYSALAISLLLGGIIIHNVMAENYTEIIKSIDLTSAHTSFENNEGGAWNVTKSAKWTSSNSAQITFNVDTIAKVRDNSGIDVVLVIDTSGSMAGEKINQVKHDAKGLVEEIIANHNGRVAIVNFSTAATIQSGLTDNLDNLNGAIDSLTAIGETNYNAGLTKAGEVLAEYQDQPERKLTLLFLTDGYPNLDTPNEGAAYRSLKAYHPSMLISGIQYEMDETILDPIKSVSDQQFVADMGSLDNVLVSSLYEPVVFGDFIVTDYINNDYWEVADSSSITASAGEFELFEDDDGQYITWNLSDEFGSGASAELTIDIMLKENVAYDENTYLPTNTHESVISTIVDLPSENVVSSATPVLKAKYRVTYDANLPTGCDSYSGTLPQGGNYAPLSTVSVPADSISCDGYNFIGWQDANGSLGVLNGDYIRIQNNDIALKGIWSKVNIKKSMDGAVQGGTVAWLNGGLDINKALKELTGQVITDDYDSWLNTTITAIKSANSMSAAQMANAVDISAPDIEPRIPIYAWFDDNDGTIYIYSEAGTIRGNPDMTSAFAQMAGLADMSGVADWDMSETRSLSSAISNTSLLNFDDLRDWDVSNVLDMSGIFYGNYLLEDISGLASWNTSNVKNMFSAFNGSERLIDISPLANWDVSNVQSMEYMFFGIMNVESLDPLANWNVGNVDAMDNMFQGARSITNVNALANWNTGNVVYMNNMFVDTPNLTNLQGLASWNTSSVTHANNMFYSSGITNVDALADWDVRSLQSAYGMFSNAANLTDISGLADWKTNSLVDTSGMFYGAALTDLNALSGWDMSHVTRMPYMFMNMPNLSDISGLSGWDTGSVTSMASLFHNTPNIDNISALSSWNTGNVTDVSNMFHGVVGLTDISGASGWNTGNVTDLSYMFAYGFQITSLTVLNNWDTHSVLEKGNMFLNIPDYIERPSWWDL